MRREVWFGLSIMALVVILVFVLMPAPSQMTNGHLGLLMLALIVVGIMLGFPTAFTLMGMGMFFGWLVVPQRRSDDSPSGRCSTSWCSAPIRVMSNDVLIAIPLFVFMGYLVERAALIDRLFRSLHLATARVPGALAVATIVTCAIFATATGIVGAVVTLMGLLAFPAMLKAGYNIKVAAGAVTRGRLPRHPDPALGAADRLRRRRRRVGGAALRRRLLSRDHARGALHRVRHPARDGGSPHLMPPLRRERTAASTLPPLAQALARHGSNALTGLWRALVGGVGAGVSPSAPRSGSWSSRCCRRCSSPRCWASSTSGRPRRRSRPARPG